jgi:hypothetical protein
VLVVDFSLCIETSPFYYDAEKATNVDIDAIEKDQSWDPVNIPAGKDAIGVKWICKTKYNANGEIEKHKEMLVAIGYSQQCGTIKKNHQ